MSNRRSLCWLRRDLRIRDSAVLAEATQTGHEAAVVFVWDETILSKIQDSDNRRVTFIHESLRELDENLRKHGSHLIVRRGDPVEEIPKLAEELKADVVVWGEDYDPQAIKRDARVVKALSCETYIVKDIVIFHKDEVLSQSGTPFKVFTPYSRAWRHAFHLEKDGLDHHAHLDRLIKSPHLPASHFLSLKELGFNKVDLWIEAGEAAGQKRLKAFADRIADYGTSRDFPATHATSHLSVDFRFGAVSIRDAVRLAHRHRGSGAEKWLSELIWRDFYQAILFNFPQVVDEPFQPEFKDVEYPGTEHHWELWRDGQTGYPIVDAAMRCLNQTGFMHNRLRMIVASFLSKDLLLEYKKGERWFAKQLLDYELASNNGGWQWASSVGCDPQPYFRIFNPLLQSKKFDPDGDFIREWIPELRELSNAAIHFPAEASQFDLESAGVSLGENYPHPCVDHGAQRDRAIALLEPTKKKSG